MFFGSSVEGKSIADALALSLDHVVDCVPWSVSFPLSENTIDALLATFPDVDFGAFVLSPDDKTTMREMGFEVARDNVLFEAGLFMGSHGKSRTFLITPRDHPNFHIPTDLLGLTPATYDGARAKSDPRGALYNVATQVRHAVDRAVKNERALDITRYATEKAGLTWPLKGFFKLKNHHQASVALRSLDFAFQPSAPRAPNATIKRRVFVPEFYLGQDNAKRDLYGDTFILRPGHQTDVWVPFDPTIGLTKLKDMVAGETAGVWRFRETWLDDTAEVRNRAIRL